MAKINHCIFYRPTSTPYRLADTVIFNRMQVHYETLSYMKKYM